jgi:hypothetical protein
MFLEKTWPKKAGQHYQLRFHDKLSCYFKSAAYTIAKGGIVNFTNGLLLIWRLQTFG